MVYGRLNQQNRMEEDMSEEETNADRFKRIGELRLNKCLKQIRLLGNLSGPKYESTPEQRAIIKERITTAVECAMARFDQKENSDEHITL